VSGRGISWTICKSAPRSRQITTPAPHCSLFYRPDALPAIQPTASKHWRNKHWRNIMIQNDLLRKHNALLLQRKHHVSESESMSLPGFNQNQIWTVTRTWMHSVQMQIWVWVRVRVWIWIEVEIKVKVKVCTCSGRVHVEGHSLDLHQSLGSGSGSDSRSRSRSQFRSSQFKGKGRSPDLSSASGSESISNPGSDPDTGLDLVSDLDAWCFSLQQQSILLSSWCYASRVPAMALFLSACHKSVFQRDCWINRVGFWHESFLQPVL